MADEETPEVPDPEPTPVKNSILNTIKTALGVGSDYDPFDAELIIHINSVFSNLHQMGVGPSSPYSIAGEENVWSEFIESRTDLESVKTYVYAKVRLIFDPPATSFGIKAFEELCKEYEWRLNVKGETP